MNTPNEAENVRHKTSKLTRLIFFFFLFVFLITAGGHFYYHDGYHKYLIVDSIAKGQGPFHEIFYTPNAAGKNVSSFPFGTSLWMSPFYWIGKWVDACLRLCNPNFPVEQPVLLISMFVMFLNSFAVAGICAVYFKLAVRMRYSIRVSFFSTCLLGFATTLWPYSKFCFSEPQTGFLLMLSFYYLYGFKMKPKYSSLVWSGLFFGLALITKYEVLVLVPVFFGYLFYFLATCPDGQKRSRALYFLFPVALAGSGILLWNVWTFNDAFMFGRYDFFVRNLRGYFLLAIAVSAVAVYGTVRYRNDEAFAGWVRKNSVLPIALACVVTFVLVFVRANRDALVYRALFSAGKSIFIYSPVLLFSLFGFRRFYDRSKSEALFVLFLFVSYLLLLRSDTVWGWGSRYYVTLIPFLMIPVLAVLEDLSKKHVIRGLMLGVVLCSLYVQILSISVNYQDSFNLIDRWVARHTKTPITNFEDESRLVFSRMIYDPKYSPLSAQYTVLKSVLSGRTEPFRDQWLMKSGKIRGPEEWQIDFWWLYLAARGVNLVGVYSVVLLLFILMSRCLVSILAVLKREPTSSL